MFDDAETAELVEKPRAWVVGSGSCCEVAQRREVGRSSPESWRVALQIQQLTDESSYGGVAFLVLQLS